MVALYVRFRGEGELDRVPVAGVWGGGEVRGSFWGVFGKAFGLLNLWDDGMAG